MRNERISVYVKIFNLIGNLLNLKHDNYTSSIINYVCEVFHKIKLNRFYAVGFPNLVVREVALQVDSCDEYLTRIHATETILHNSLVFPSQPHWVNISFTRSSKQTSRAFKLLKWNRLPSNCLVVSSETLFNVKRILSTDPYKLLPPNTWIRFVINSLGKYHHPEASKVVVSFFTSSLTVWSNNAAKKALEHFLRTPRLMREGDVVTVEVDDIHLPQFDLTTPLRFTVENIEGCTEKLSNVCEHSDGVFAVTQLTAVYEVTNKLNFAPPRILSKCRAGSWLSAVPPGMEKYFAELLSWFQPFLFETHRALYPCFIIYGPSGAGKTVLLSLLSEYMGIGFQSVDSYDLVSNVQSHIAASVKGLSKLVVNSVPCIIELFNAEVLCSGDAVDSDQVFATLKKMLTSLVTPYPMMFVLSTSDLDRLNHSYVNLSLHQLFIDKPADERKKFLISWIATKNSVIFEKGADELLLSETSSFHLGDLEKLICSSCLLQKESSLFCSTKLLESQLRNMQASGSSVVVNSDWQDIGGVEDIKREVLNSLLTSRLMPTVKRTGLLLHGPPGTGKTLLARTVASQCNRSFVSVKGPELLNMYVGQSEANIRQVFQRAKESAPCIMFFDELDSLAPNRGNKSDAGGVIDRVVSQLLTEIDSLESDDIFILGATNRPDLIDPALLRPGRFDKMVFVGPCEDETSKIKVLKALTRKFHMEEGILYELGKILPRQMTGANLYSLCSTAWNLAATEVIASGDCGLEVKVKVCARHFKDAARDLFNVQRSSDGD